MSEILIPVLITAALTAGASVAVMKLIDRLRKRDASVEAERIVERAEQDATAKLREADLEIKEYRGASIVKSVGAKTLGDQRMLR